MKFVAIDFETANREPHSACAIGLVRVESGKIVSQRYSLICPPVRNFEFTHIHHITWDDVCQSPSWADLLPWVRETIDGVDFLAAHHAAFDREILESCCNYYRLDSPNLPFLCTVKLARLQWGIYPTKLPNVCQKLGIELQHHQALSDARACAQIVCQSYAQLRNAKISAAMLD
jgi:DNA polymerase III subunit epsilon